MPLLKLGGTLVSFIYPAQHPRLVEALAAQGMTVLGALRRRCTGAAGRRKGHGLPASGRIWAVPTAVLTSATAPALVSVQAWIASRAPSPAPRPLTRCPPWPTLRGTGGQV